ncbi:MAG: flagellar hook basal-body protein [Terriglobales bacterium]|jgi:flagellar basal-body rod protein FlgF/flagellar basal-body rod protein FlgG
MDSGFYAACTALLARNQALDLVANNLANVGTPGFRGQHGVFRSLLASSSIMQPSSLNRAVNNYAVLGDADLDLSQGNVEHTGNDLDFALQGSGFFAVKTGSTTMFTRNGNFHVSAQGQLVTAAGDPVMGDNNGPIQIVGAPVSVSADGTISVNGVLAGKLKVVDFPAGTQLTALGQSYYSAPANTKTSASQASIQQGGLESSNVNEVSSAVQLVTVQRYAELMQRALYLFHSEMNQIATQELPKIS